MTVAVLLFCDSGLQVNTNGILSFRSAFTSATLEMFPLSVNIPLIAPFWGDVNIRRFGNIFYRETSNATLLQRARDQLQGLFPSSANFIPSTLFIATWERVAEYVPFFRVGGPQVTAIMTVSLLIVGERAEILAWKLRSGKLNLSLALSLCLTLHEA